MMDFQSGRCGLLVNAVEARGTTSSRRGKCRSGRGVACVSVAPNTMDGVHGYSAEHIYDSGAINAAVFYGFSGALDLIHPAALS
jgi:hypothetical protein